MYPMRARASRMEPMTAPMSIIFFLRAGCRSGERSMNGNAMINATRPPGIIAVANTVKGPLKIATS